MKKVLKWIGILLGGLVGVVLLLVVVLITMSSARLSKSYDLQPAAVDIPGDAQSIGRGAYLYASSCAGCHGDDLSGGVVLDDPAIGFIPAPNLTGGEGGVGNRYDAQGLVRAIRHGIGYDGRALIVMPSRAYWYFSDADLGAIIAYLQSVPSVDKRVGERTIKPMGRILLAVGAFGDIFAAEVIDHNAPRPAAPEPGVTAAYGEYLVNTGECSTCHGPDLTGGQSPEPGAPFSPDLTPGGALSGWSVEDFITAMRTGLTPEGHKIDGNFMPWEALSRKTDDDLSAIFLYLQSLPASVESN